MKGGGLVSKILVGGVAAHVNRRLEIRGEDLRMSAKKVGVTLKSLGLRTEKLGRLGRGLQFGSILRREIHEIALQMGVDRRTITPLTALESGHGGAPCSLCEQLGLTGGLEFVEILKLRRDRHAPPPEPPSPPTPSEDNEDREAALPTSG